MPLNQKLENELVRVAYFLQPVYNFDGGGTSRCRAMTTFGQRIREMRQVKGWTLRQLAPMVGVGYTYLSKIENEKLDFGDYPSEALIHRLADALDADEEELLILADKIPQPIRKRVKERPDAFRQLAHLDDETLDKVLANIDAGNSRKRKKA